MNRDDVVTSEMKNMWQLESAERTKIKGDLKVLSNCQAYCIKKEGSRWNALVTVIA